MKRKPPAIVSDSDRDLFREAVGSVRRLADRTHGQRVPAPAPEARSRQRDEAEALALFRRAPLAVGEPDAAEPLAWRGPRINQRQFRKLRRGQFAVQDELDLHHLTAAQATPVLGEFLRTARAGGATCVRIVHGKGRRSQHGGPVLKGLVDRLLSRRRDVLAYASAPPAMGGTGAVLVLLARARPGECLGPHPGDDEDTPPPVV
ncbi:MAG TPA: Smr/MutS family protein [Xanthomonadaceae bacterium]|nr:Smr/MutS family protein [Xanthomonadaceae bacterium]